MLSRLIHFVHRLHWNLYRCHKQTHIFLTYLIFCITHATADKSRRKKNVRKIWQNIRQTQFFAYRIVLCSIFLLLCCYLCSKKQMPQTLKMFHVLNTFIFQLVFRSGCAKRISTLPLRMRTDKNRKRKEDRERVKELGHIEKMR